MSEESYEVCNTFIMAQKLVIAVSVLQEEPLQSKLGPDNHLGRSVVALLCFFPFGIIALMHSLKVKLLLFSVC